MTQDAENSEKIDEGALGVSEEKGVSENENIQDSSEAIKYKEKYYYMAAEYDNALKRLEREKSNIIKFGSENILRDIIGSIDLFELTVSALQNDPDPKIKNIMIGLEMIRKQMLETLGKHGLEKMKSLGETFDPNFHEAVAQEANSSVEENSIIKELQAGYKLNGRLIRAAKVVVSKKE